MSDETTSGTTSNYIDPEDIEPMFADLLTLKYQISAYLGGFSLLFLISIFFTFDQSEEDSFMVFLPSISDFDFSEIYTIFFLLQILILGTIPALLLLREELVHQRGHLVLFLISAYLFVSSMTLLLTTFAVDEIAFDIIIIGLLFLSLGIGYYGYSYSYSSKVPNWKRDRLMGLGALVYGFSLYLSTHEIVFALFGDIEVPATSGYYGILTYQDGPEIFFDITSQFYWFYPTLHEWILGGMFWIFTGAYFLIKGYNLGIKEQDFYKFEDLIWILFSLALFYFNFDMLLNIIEFGFGNFTTILLLLINLTGIYLSYEVNFPLKDRINTFRARN